MKIGFDAKRAFLNQSGLGNYSRNLLSSLFRYFPGHDYLLYTTKRSDSSFSRSLDQRKNVSVTTPDNFIDKKLGGRWRSYGITPLLNQAQAGVYHGLSNELPFNIHKFSGKKIVTIHDLIFLRYPELYPALDRKIYDKKFRKACAAADLILAVSRQTASDLQEFYGIPEKKIKVIYQSCNEAFYSPPAAAEAARIREKYKLPERYLLYVGTIEERKNLLTVVKALREVKDVPLVAVGKKKGYFSEVAALIKEYGLGPRIFLPDQVNNEELPAIYRGAELFIYPSVFEGFGIPVLEALTSRVPVITTRGGCFAEAGGPHSSYIDPMNAEELAAEINAILASPERRSRMAEAGYAHALGFAPERIAAQLMHVYQGT